MCVLVLISRVQNKVAALSSRHASAYYLSHRVEENIVSILAAEHDVYYYDYNFQNYSKIHLLTEFCIVNRPGEQGKCR